MTRFEVHIFGVGSDHSTNCATAIYLSLFLSSFYPLSLPTLTSLSPHDAVTLSSDSYLSLSLSLSFVRCMLVFF